MFLYVYIVIHGGIFLALRILYVAFSALLHPGVYQGAALEVARLLLKRSSTSKPWVQIVSKYAACNEITEPLIYYVLVLSSSPSVD